MLAPQKEAQHGSAGQRGNFQAAKEGWLKAVASHPNLSGADYAVAIFIATYLNSESHTAWPSIETLAAATNRHRSTVWRSIERLEAFKLLEVARARGRTKSNRYSLTQQAIQLGLLPRLDARLGKKITHPRLESTQNNQISEPNFFTMNSNWSVWLYDVNSMEG